MTPTLVVVHNNIDSESSIGALARWSVEVALSQDFCVIALCRDLDPSLRGQVVHVPLSVPKGMHLNQYLQARGTVRKALSGVRFDLMHVHQAQLAALADTWHVHFMLRGALRRQAFDVHEDHAFKARARARQYRLVALAEDRYIRQISGKTLVLPCSEMVAADLKLEYSLSAPMRILRNPALSTWATPTPSDRMKARAKFSLPSNRKVLAFLGGNDPRKAGDRMLSALKGRDDITVLLAGDGAGTLAGRHRSPLTIPVGKVVDVRPILLASDALIVPSIYDPYPIAVIEAASLGIPLIVSDGVGSASSVVHYKAGLIWDAHQSFSDLVDRILSTVPEFQRGAYALAASADANAQAAILTRAWGEALASGGNAWLGSQRPR